MKGGPQTHEAPSPPGGPCPERVGKLRSPHERGSDVPPEPSVPRRPGREDAGGEEPPPGARLGEEAHGSSVLTKGEALEWAPGGPLAPGTAPSGVPAPCGSPTSPRDLALNLGTRHSFLLQRCRSMCLVIRSEAGKGTWSGDVRNGQLSGAEGCPCSSSDTGTPARIPREQRRRCLPGWCPVGHRE